MRRYPLQAFQKHNMKPVEEGTDGIEEDWSSILADTTGSAYKNYDCIEIFISSSTCLKINCVQSLTPLDILALSNGTGDATGNKVWTAAYFFISSFAMAYPPHICSKEPLLFSHSGIPIELYQLRKTLFNDKIVLELGCGTGVSGLSLIVSGFDHQRQELCKPAWFVFTDGDDNTLSLCRKNAESNLSVYDEQHYSFVKLAWGEEESIESLRINLNHIGQVGIQGFDTIIATDILYDLEALRPIFNTVHTLLVDQGFFVLALVPRISLDESQAVSDIGAIEQLIESVAQLYKMKRLYRIRPQDLSAFMENSLMPKGIQRTQDMESKDSSILIFQSNIMKNAI